MKSKIEISTNKEFKQLMLKYSTVNIEEFNVNINLLRGFAARDIELIGKHEGYEYIIFGFDNYKTYNTDYYEDINTFIREVGDYEIYNLFENLTFDWIDGASWFSKVQRIEWEKGTPKKTKKRPSRRKVFDFINFKTNSLIDINFFNLSTINSTGKFSVEPKLGSEEQEWFLALVDTSKNIINFFIVPANSSVYNKLYVREDKQVYRLIFPLNDISYREEYSYERFDKFQVDKYDFEDESIF